LAGVEHDAQMKPLADALLQVPQRREVVRPHGFPCLDLESDQAPVSGLEDAVDIVPVSGPIVVNGGVGLAPFELTRELAEHEVLQERADGHVVQPDRG